MSSPKPSASAQTVESPENRVAADIPVQTRSERFASGDPADFAPVTGREPEWKLSPVAALRPLIDGDLDGSAYEVSLTTDDGATLSWVAVAEVERGVAGLAEDKAAANAWAATSEVLVLEMSGDCATTLELHRQDLGTGARAAHTLIRLRPHSRATLLVRSSGDALLAENIEFDIGADAQLRVVFVNEWNSGAVHYAQHFATVGRGGSLTHICVSLGGDVVVLNPSVRLVGERSEGHLWGAYFADATQHLEHRVFVHHEGPNTVSRVTYKGALHGSGARTVWIGDVLIGQNAVGTDSYEQNRNLVLSEGTRADSIPNLEIKTGDIHGAGHASATGRFDDEQLFYLRSRGIHEDDARRLVVMGFLTEVISQIPDTALVEHLTEKIRTKLSATEGAL